LERLCEMWNLRYLKMMDMKLVKCSSKKGLKLNFTTR
jgi:hypothetical protein